MNNHLTPGAKALRKDNNEVVDIVEYLGRKAPEGMTRVRVRDVFWWEPTDNLTPLLTAVVQEDGKVKEVNRFGEYPKDGEFADEGSCDAWKEIESQRRTWEPIIYFDEAEHGAWDSDFVPDLTPPAGTTVLGYEKDGKFIIVETQNQ